MQAAETGSAGEAAIAAAFMAARRDARGLGDYPGALPETLAAGYAVQDQAIRLASAPIAGWKVGRIVPPFDRRFGRDRIAGPIFADHIVHDGGGPYAMPVFADGFAAAEAEYLLRIGAAPAPGKRDFSLDEAAALIDRVHIGIEIASSPFAAINALGPAVTISDFGNNHGLVVGAKITEWRTSNYLDWPVIATIDGVEVGAATAAGLPDGPIGAARFLFALMAERGIALARGLWISSGAVTGVHPVRPGARFEARFGDFGATRCTIEAAVAQGDG